jgi:hypothetical protein
LDGLLANQLAAHTLSLVRLDRNLVVRVNEVVKNMIRKVSDKNRKILNLNMSIFVRFIKLFKQIVYLDRDLILKMITHTTTNTTAPNPAS